METTPEVTGPQSGQEGQGQGSLRTGQRDQVGSGDPGGSGLSLCTRGSGPRGLHTRQHQGLTGQQD